MDDYKRSGYKWDRMGELTWRAEVMLVEEAVILLMFSCKRVICASMLTEPSFICKCVCHFLWCFKFYRNFFNRGSVWYLHLMCKCKLNKFRYFWSTFYHTKIKGSKQYLYLIFIFRKEIKETVKYFTQNSTIQMSEQRSSAFPFKILHTNDL